MSPPTAPARRRSPLSRPADTRPDPLVPRLRAGGCVFAEDEAALLRQAATGPALEDLVARRVAGEPLEQLLGWVDFAGVRVRLLPGVFVPRQRSALLVDLAREARAGIVVDLCCGSGAIGAAVAARAPEVEVHAADVDPRAVECARLNLPADRVHEGDLYDALPADLRSRIDVLVVNAPYVPTDAIAMMPPEARDHEPRLALDGGPDGVDLHRRVAEGAAAWLRPDGRLVIETGRDQAGLTAAACRAAGLVAGVRHDHDRGATAVVATVQAAAAG